MALIIFLIILAIIFLILYDFSPGAPKKNNNTRDKDYWDKFLNPRRYYYRNVYLKSDAWQRKRYVVLKRDNWRCVYCGGPATQVHHKKYLRRKIGKEPIDWLVSVCTPCHDLQHK